jgi:hypothetical protein
MARELRLARQASRDPVVPQDADSSWSPALPNPTHNLSSCEHRAVSKDGRIVCQRIVEGDNEVSPNECRDCPFKAVNCAHLMFSLLQISPSPLIVRYNGRTEIWDDEPPELRFERAACTAKVMPIHGPRACAECALHKPLQAPVERPARRRKVAGAGKVVPFPGREPLAATG